MRVACSTLLFIVSNISNFSLIYSGLSKSNYILALGIITPITQTAWFYGLISGRKNIWYYIIKIFLVFLCLVQVIILNFMTMQSSISMIIGHKLSLIINSGVLVMTVLCAFFMFFSSLATMIGIVIMTLLFLGSAVPLALCLMAIKKIKRTYRKVVHIMKN